MKRAAVLLLALLLVPAAQADAKFSSARVCGPSDCRDVGLAAGHSILTITEAAFSTRSRLTSKPPDAAAPWYRVTLCPGRCGLDGAFALKVLPSVGYEYVPPREEGQRKGWAKLDEHSADVYRRVTADLEPFPASGLIPLGAAPPDPAHGDGFPRWAWILIAGAIAALSLIALRRGAAFDGRSP